MVLDVRVEDRIATVTLNRPEVMNAVDPEMRALLHETWRRIADDREIRVAIVTGAGDRAFCTGADLKKTMPPAESFAAGVYGGAGLDRLTDGMIMDIPLICAVNGYAVGGGLEIALACDIRLAVPHATFGLSEVRVGSIPGSGGTQLLPRAIGRSMAMQMLLTGDRIDAETALRVGLISEVVDADRLLERATEVARRIADNAPLAVRAVKRLVRRGEDLPLEAGFELERFSWGLLRDTEDRIEGRRAFAEKRPPQYRGR